MGSVTQLVDWGLLDPQKVPAADVKAYDEWYVQRRRKTEAFWKASVADLPTNGIGTIGVRQYLGLTHIDPVRWPERGGTMLGSASIPRIAEYVAPVVYPFGFGQKAEKGRRIIRDAVIIPFSDLPGRHSSFLHLFGGREGEIKSFYRQCTSTAAWSHTVVPLPGVTPIDAVLEPPGALGSTLFVIPEPTLVVKLQTRHKELQRGWLPVVGVWPAAAPCPFLTQQSPNKDIVVWMLKPDADGFKHAKEYNARVYWSDHTLDEEMHLLRRFATSADWLAAQSKRAIPWQEALYNLTKTHPAHLVDSILRRLGMTLNETKSFYLLAPEEVKVLLNGTRASASVMQQVLVGTQIVKQDERGWTLENGELVSTAPIRIDQVLVRPGTDKAWFRGVVSQKGVECPFTAPREEVEADPFKFISKVLLSHGAQLPRFRERWGSRYLEIAKEFHEPTTVQIPSPGWDAKNDRFVFHNFALNMDGRVTDVTMPDEGELKPSANLKPPTPVMPDELALLCRRDNAAIVWPIVGAVLYNLIAPAFGRRARSTLLIGGSQAAISVAEACGCARRKAQVTGGAYRPGRLDAVETKEGWPLVVDYIPLSRRYYEEWMNPEERNVIAGLEEFPGMTLFANGGWFAMTPPRTRVVNKQVLLSVERVIPDFLEFFLSRRLGGSAWNIDLTVRIEEELAAYFKARQATCDPPRIKKLLWKDQARARAFATIAMTAVYRKWVSPSVVADTAEGVRITAGVLSDALVDHSEPALKLENIKQALEGASALVEERIEDGEVYWFIDRNWFDARRATFQALSPFRTVDLED